MHAGRGSLRCAVAIALALTLGASVSPQSVAADAGSGGLVGPENVLLVVNSAYPGSEELALYYAQGRAIPRENIFILEMPTTEDIDRDSFNMKILSPIAAKVTEKQGIIRCIVLFRGVPLNIWDPLPAQRRISILKQELAGINDGTFQGEQKVLEQEIGKLEGEIKELTQQAASVDSELALLDRDHLLPGHVENPFTVEDDWPEGCVWVSRLDATSEADVRSMIDGASDAEHNGLKGIAYFDARGLIGEDGYSRADAGIREAADLTQRQGYPVVTESTDRLFGPGECPDAAIYWGWYSLAQYVDAFSFRPGAIAVHIASGECNSLREGAYWCRNLIAHGAAVTLGPTNEPYLEAFPRPDAFLERLYKGESVGEAYYETLPWLSWRMVLLGDPLYRPFAGKGEAGAGADE